jgi:hypothetical protein
MSTKKELEQKIKVLEDVLEGEQSRPTGHTISDCHIEMKDDTKIAIAEAVKEGMKALQSLDGKSYGIYLGVDND